MKKNVTMRLFSFAAVILALTLCSCSKKSKTADEKALEINLKVQEVLLTKHTKYILNLYKSLGGKYLTLSSDAHELDKFRLHFDKYIKIIKDSGFDNLVYFVNRNKYLFKIS